MPIVSLCQSQNREARPLTKAMGHSPSKLTSRISEKPIKGDNEPLEGSLSIKGNLSDLIKIMEAIKNDHLYPKQEMSNVIREILTDSMLPSEPRKYVFDYTATEGHGAHNYDEGGLSKINCIKKIREILGTGLKESKDFVDGEGRHLSEVEVVALRSAGLVVLARP
jgi:Fic family protein